MKVDLGKRIRFFRDRAEMSQLDLEAATGLASGAISRIEHNQVNPTKETILSIGKVLNLGNREIDYLIGKTALPPTQDEINKARKEASKFLNKRGRLAYLLDERWRFQMISKTFIKLLKFEPTELDYIIGKTTAEVIVDKDSPVLKRVDQDFYKELLAIYLPQYYSRLSYMDDDEIYLRTVEAIMKNNIAKEIWTGLVSQNYKKDALQEDRFIRFDIWGVKFSLYYAMVPLMLNSRFKIIEFSTKNKVLDLLPYLA